MFLLQYGHTRHSFLTVPRWQNSFGDILLYCKYQQDPNTCSN